MQKSELVSWSKIYSMGYRLIDEQHQKLFDLVNDLFNHVTGNETKERLYFQKVIKEAVDYIKVHFATEEKIMLQVQYAGYQEHKKTHDAFILKVAENVRDFAAGKKFNLASFTRFLKDWILTHIAIMDKQYFTYFKKIATRKADGKLSITKGDINN